MDINILQNLEKQRLIVRKLLVPVPIRLFSDGEAIFLIFNENVYLSQKKGLSILIEAK